MPEIKWALIRRYWAKDLLQTPCVRFKGVPNAGNLCDRGGGFVDVLHVKDPADFQRLAHIETASGPRVSKKRLVKETRSVAAALHHSRSTNANALRTGRCTIINASTNPSAQFHQLLLAATRHLVHEHRKHGGQTEGVKKWP